MAPHQGEILLAAIGQRVEQKSALSILAGGVVKGITGEETVPFRDLMVQANGEKKFIGWQELRSDVPADSPSHPARVGY